MSQEKTVRKNMPVGEPDPRQGCLMFAVGGLVIVTLVTWGVFSFQRQKTEILKFTEAAPAALVLPQVDAAALAAAVLKLNTAADQPGETTVTLEAAECLAIMGSHPLATELQPQIVLTGVDTELHFDCALALPNLGTYLNAKVTGRPGVDAEDGLTIHTTKLEVPGKAVPEQFAEGYHDQHFFAQLLLMNVKKDQRAGVFLRRVTAAEVREGRLMLTLKAAGK